MSNSCWRWTFSYSKSRKSTFNMPISFINFCMYYCKFSVWHNFDILTHCDWEELAFSNLGFMLLFSLVVLWWTQVFVLAEQAQPLLSFCQPFLHWLFLKSSITLCLRQPGSWSFFLMRWQAHDTMSSCWLCPVNVLPGLSSNQASW
jgi:hypothetical protein